MLFTSPVYSQASGSIAGITFSHNRGGMYTRARVTPTDPSSFRQQEMRTAMGTLAPYWGETLTAGERAAWDLYGDNVPMINPLGQTIFLTGQQHFLRCNLPRLQNELAILDVAPTNFNLGTFTAPTIDEANDAPVISIAFDNTDAWAVGVGYMFVYGGKAQGPGRAFYKGPWRFAGASEGGGPPGSPLDFISQYPLAIGNLVWAMVRFMQVDGRLSLPVILGPETVVAGP
jgi:hypothetical protein